VIAAVFTRIGAEAVRVAGFRPDTLVLSHPAGWGPVRRLTLADAAEIADLPAPTFVAEPVAAARYFAGVLGGVIAPGQTLLVFDRGAGTCDVSVIRDGSVLGTDGIDDVGGIDFDADVVEWLRDRRASSPSGLRSRCGRVASTGARANSTT
jgi:molecular chaperone DnaK (HSP70)